MGDVSAEAMAIQMVKWIPLAYFWISLIIFIAFGLWKRYKSVCG